MDVNNGYCEFYIGPDIVGLQDELRCSRRARWRIIVHISDHPRDALPFAVCGRHVTTFKRQFGESDVDILGEIPMAERPPARNLGKELYDAFQRAIHEPN